MLAPGGYKSLWYNAWYEHRGKALIEAKEQACRISEANKPVIRSRNLDNSPEALVGSAPTSRASVPSKAHFTSPGQREDGELIKMRNRKKLAVNHLHAKARLQRARAKK
jgi:hypothetical protein